VLISLLHALTFSQLNVTLQLYTPSGMLSLLTC